MTLEPPRTSQPHLVRAIGRWSMVALAVNSILGSGIFGLPSAVAALVGAWSVWAVLIAGAGMGVIIACYAEVASPFDETGGPYLYLRYTFGRFVGMLVTSFWSAGAGRSRRPTVAARMPLRAGGLALFTSLAILLARSGLLQLIVTTLAPRAAESGRPRADAACAAMGPAGAARISV